MQKYNFLPTSPLSGVAEMLASAPHIVLQKVCFWDGKIWFAVATKLCGVAVFGALYLFLRAFSLSISLREVVKSGAENGRRIFFLSIDSVFLY